MGPRSFGHTGYTGDSWWDGRGGGGEGGARMSVGMGSDEKMRAGKYEGGEA